MPQPPQLEPSLVTSTQTPLQMYFPPGGLDENESPLRATQGVLLARWGLTGDRALAGQCAAKPLTRSRRSPVAVVNTVYTVLSKG